MWQSAELVLRDVTTQQQLGPPVRGRRATIATMSEAEAAVGGGDGDGSGAGDVAADRLHASGGGGKQQGKGNSRGGRRAAGAAKGVGGAGGGGSAGGVVSDKQLQKLGGGVTPVAFRTRHRGR